MWLRKTLLFIMLVVSPFISMGQLNLINNPSFEDQDTCPHLFPAFLIANCVGWFSPLGTTPDCFNSCANSSRGVPTNFAGFQYAHSGECYAGLINAWVLNQNLVNYQEYIETKLLNELKKDELYEVSFFISFGKTNYICNSLGVFFSEDSIFDPTCNYSFCHLNVMPQLEYSGLQDINVDTTQWFKVTFNYLATGREQYMIIGNFRDSTTNIIREIDSRYGDLSYLYIDDIFLGKIDLKIPNVITPDNDGKNDLWLIKDDRITKIDCIIYNRWGEIIFKSNDIRFDWNGYNSRGELVTNGVYFYLISVQLNNEIQLQFHGNLQVLY
jgi:OmpA-OmpF porin, OOP family